MKKSISFTQDCTEDALRLSKLFGNSPEFRLNAQQAVDLWNAKRAAEDEIKHIKPIGADTIAALVRERFPEAELRNDNSDPVEWKTTEELWG